MKMSTLDSRVLADEGAWLHLRHPATGELLYDDGEPCRVLVRGQESKTAMAALAKLLKDRKAGELSDIEGNHARNAKAAAILIMGYDHMEGADAKPLVAPDDNIWFLSLGIPVGNPDPDQKTFGEQINAFAADRANFLGRGSRA